VWLRSLNSQRVVEGALKECPLNGVSRAFRKSKYGHGSPLLTLSQLAPVVLANSFKRRFRVKQSKGILNRALRC